ncbi:hypothetical protein FB451DRAFT_1420057 [Mycena latifolia]|nr:hypothetical protein FB451DRAFT_1420057 [Mycena latifolia]
MSQQIPMLDVGDYLRYALNLPSTSAPVCSHSGPSRTQRVARNPAPPLPLLIKLAVHGTGKRTLTPQQACGELITRFRWFLEHQRGRIRCGIASNSLVWQGKTRRGGARWSTPDASRAWILVSSRRHRAFEASASPSAPKEDAEDRR